MPDSYSNSFAVPVDDELAIEIEYDMQDGTPMPFVVRLMAHVEGRKVCVSRFDSAHPEKPPHRDVLGHRDGLRHKVFYETLDYRDAVFYAILDLKKYGHEYFKDYLRH
jgi:hypothetical protein